MHFFPRDYLPPNFPPYVPTYIHTFVRSLILMVASPGNLIRHIAACCTVWVSLTFVGTGQEVSKENQQTFKLTPPRGTSRIENGVLALYRFEAGSGSAIQDVSGFGQPLDLRIRNLEAVRWGDGHLEVHANAQIASVRTPGKLVNALRRSGAITLEAWIEPANMKQTGPARIVSLSSDPSNRNATLGQDKDRIDFRLRTTKTSSNGLPSTTSQKKSLSTGLIHVVFTRDRNGQARLYLDGEPQVQTKVAGTFANWDENYPLVLADEVGGGRPWRGTYHLLALYGRSLTKREVAHNFRLGPKAVSQPQKIAHQKDHFVETIAPILVQNCLECHDAINSKGDLDLSHRKSALAGGDSGPSIIPGKAHNSVLIESILSDDMPKNREPLSAEQKQILVDWVNQGANWSIEYVDPVLFTHSSSRNQLWIRRLTLDEYINTVQATVGVDIAEAARRLLPSDLRADGFANTAYNLNVDLKHIEAYARLAELIVGQIDVQQFARRFHNRLKFTDKDMKALMESMGTWVLRGPLDADELIALQGIYTTVGAAGGDVDDVISLALEAMLQSPRFLYRIENQHGDGERWPLSSFELASRISYLLWGSSPDEALFESAAADELFEPEILEGHIDRLLRDRRADVWAEQFIDQWLNLSGLSNLNPNRESFPTWNAHLAEDMRLETRAFFKHVAIEQNRPLSDLLTADVTFATPRLAKHYHLHAEPGKVVDQENGLHQYDLSKDPARGGLLTQGSVLTIGGDEASMVTRGLFVLRNLLRGAVQDPPPCVDTTPVPIRAGVSQRAIAQQRIDNEACGGCHRRFEPLAFGLERFDGLGAFHKHDEFGNPLRQDGTINVPGEREVHSYQTIKELTELLADSDRVQRSFTWKLTQFALGRPLEAKDAREVKAIHESAHASGGTYRATMKAIALSELVLSTATESTNAEN